MNVPDKIIVHHTASGGMYPQFAAVNRHHAHRDFARGEIGWYVGYHYFIEKTGEVIQARREEEQGQHTTGENQTSIGICLAGNFDIEYPTAAQVAALTPLIDQIIARHHISPRAIYPHRLFANKSCYGSNLSDNWPRIQYVRWKSGWIMAQLERIMGILQKIKK